MDHVQRRHGVVTPDQVKKLEDQAARLNENDLAELWGDTQEHVRQAISAGLDSLEHSGHLIRPDAAVELVWTMDAATGEFVALWRVPCEPQLSAH